jgi:hypothetical protein
VRGKQQQGVDVVRVFVHVHVLLVVVFCQTIVHLVHLVRVVVG